MIIKNRKRFFSALFFGVLLLATLIYLSLQILFPNFKIIMPNDNFDDITIKNTKGIIAIDPGHGGVDTGTQVGDIVESKINLDISNKLKTYLENNSYQVTQTRKSDTSLDTLSNIDDTRQRKDLDARTKIIDKSGAELFVSIHVNSYEQDSRMSGSIVYYNPLSPESKKLAECIQKQLNKMKIVNFKRDTYEPRIGDYYLLNNTDIPGVIVETAFMSNPEDRKLLNQDNFKDMVAEAISKGISDFLAS